MQVTDACQDCKRNDLVMSAKGMTGLSGGVNINNNPTLQVRRHWPRAPAGAAAVPAVLAERVAASKKVHAGAVLAEMLPSCRHADRLGL